jgi:tetratricopeptide (TPR) repeat protein
MASHVLTGPEWDKALKDTVMVELDADSPEGQKWMAAWTVKAMPSYLLFDAEGHELGRILGEQSRGDFYKWLNGTLARATSLESVKASVTDAKEPSIVAAREVLRAYYERYDAAGGLAWFLALPPPVRGALARDAQASGWIARLELQRAAAENDARGCANVAPVVLAASLGCERPYELSKVMACAEKLGEPARHDLLRPQVEPMQTLVDKRVLSDSRCADERSAVTATADLYQALGDTTHEKLVLDRAIADLKKRLDGDLKKDRNLSDNLRVYLDRAGRTAELDEILDRLIEAYPQDYVYAYRKGKSLALRGKHAEALPYFEQAAAKAYGVNQLNNAELRAKSLAALNRPAEARTVLADVLKTTGPFFPDEAAKLKAYQDSLPPQSS